MKKITHPKVKFYGFQKPQVVFRNGVLKTNIETKDV